LRYKTVALSTDTLVFDELVFKTFENVPPPQAGASKVLTDTILQDIRGCTDNVCVIALGDGAGHLSIKIAKNNPAFSIIASDISPHAVEAITINAQLNKVKISVVESDLLANITPPESEKIIVAFNPPQLAASFFRHPPENPWDFLVNCVRGGSLQVVADTVSQCKAKLPGGSVVYFSLLSIHGERCIQDIFTRVGLTSEITHKTRLPINSKSMIFGIKNLAISWGGEFFMDAHSGTPPFESLESLNAHVAQHPQENIFCEVWIVKATL
jgi:methylase of polypeptide subunit release factors